MLIDAFSFSKYMQLLGERKPECLSSTKTVKSKCDGIFSIGEICDEYGTSSTCCTSDCKLKEGAVCSPVCFNYENNNRNKSILFSWHSLLVHVVILHVNSFQLAINVVLKVNANWLLNV